MIDYTNCTVNSRWHQAHQIRQTIEGMAPEDREKALIRIQAEMTLNGKTPDQDVLNYVTTLLNGKEPRKGISRRNGNGNGAH